MNVSATTIYFWQLADRVLAFTPGLAIFVTVCLVIMLLLSLINNGIAADSAAKAATYTTDNYDMRKYAGAAASAKALYAQTTKLSKIFGALAGLFFFVSAFIPTSNTIAMMVVIPEIAKSKVIQTDLPDLYNAAVSALKAAIAPEKK